MNNPERKEYTRLHRAGLDLNTQPTFETNGGSETTTHAVAKLITARLFLEEGWLADCEVTLQNGREMDVFAYNHDRLNYAMYLHEQAFVENRRPYWFSTVTTAIKLVVSRFAR